MIIETELVNHCCCGTKYFLHKCTFFREINFTSFSWKWFHGKLALFWTLEVWREATRVLSRETKIKRALKRSSHIILSSSKFGLVTILLYQFFLFEKIKKRLNRLSFIPFDMKFWYKLDDVLLRSLRSLRILRYSILRISTMYNRGHV